MDRFHLMSTFVAVAEAESFAGGARRLGLSAPAVTRAVAALEARLGVKLLHRTTRLVRTTEAGQRYLEDARRILAEADEADDTAAGINASLRGHVTVTAPTLFGRIHVTPLLVDFMQQHPQLQISALFLDRVVNMLEEGIDVGVRIGELPDSDLRAQRVGEVRRVVCASPEYLAQHGTPTHPEQLLAHQIISASAVSPTVEWKFQAQGMPLAVRIHPRMQVSSNDAAIVAATRGAGITRLLSYQIREWESAGRLQVLLTEYEPPPLPIHVVHRSGPNGAAKVRALVDHLVSSLRAGRPERY